MLDLVLGITALLILTSYAGLAGLFLGCIIGYILFKLYQIDVHLKQLSQSGQAITAPPPTPQVLPSEPYTPDVQAAPDVNQTTINPPLSKAATPFIQEGLNFFTTSNLITKLGVVVLFFGFAFLIKYAAELRFFPIEFRLATAALAGIILLVLGWHLRESKRDYALALQGGGIGILYIIIYTAYRNYHLLPPGAAFAGLILIGIAGIILSLLQNAKSLAVLSISGGFIAPLIASPLSDNPLGLYSYYTILNTVVLSIAWYKAWRPLNIIGFSFTFVMSSFWGYYEYQPEFFVITEVFLGLFFFMYFAIAILYATQQTSNFKGFVDGTIVFGVPLILCALQSYLVNHIHYGNAFSCLGLALTYSAAATWLYQYDKERFQHLIEAFLSLAIIFGTMVIPLTLSGHWTSILWAIEATCILWLGIKQQQSLARLFSYLLLIFSQTVYFYYYINSQDPKSLLTFPIIATSFIAIANLITSFLSSRPFPAKQLWEVFFTWLFFGLGIIWWLNAGFDIVNVGLATYPLTNHYINYFFDKGYLLNFNLKLLFLTASAIGAWTIYRYARWRAMYYTAISLLPILIIVSILSSIYYTFFGYQFAWGHWLLILLGWYWILYQAEAFHPGSLARLHLFSAWFTLWQLTFTISSLISRIPQLATIWSNITWGIVPIMSLWLFHLPHITNQWPISKYSTLYQQRVSRGLCYYLAGWLIYINFASTGNAVPLNYFPLLNPLDLTCLLIFMTTSIFIFKYSAGRADILAKIYGGLMLLWLNMVLLRTLHHWAAIPFDWNSFFNSRLAQVSFSVYWTTIALGMALTASKLKLRTLWLLSFNIIILITIKLFAIDLTITNILYRTLSFIAVGLLLLIIGYFSPIPPGKLLKD